MDWIKRLSSDSNKISLFPYFSNLHNSTFSRFWVLVRKINFSCNLDGKQKTRVKYKRIWKIKSIQLKFGACYITSQWGKFEIKRTIICFRHILFYCFSSLNLRCFYFHFFDKVSNFRNRILTNQKQELVIKNCQWTYMFWRETF